MVTSDERMRILEMLHEGKITPEGAAQLLQALDADQPKAAPAKGPVAFDETPAQDPLPPSAPAANGKWLHVRVTDTDSGRPRVNVRLPLKLVNLGMKLGARYAPEIDGVDIGALLAAAQMGEPGPMVDVYDEDEGEHVEVFIE